MILSNAIIYFTKLTFLNLSDLTNRYELLLDSLPSSRREKISQYVKIEDKLRSLFTWKLLEKAARDVFSLELNRETISINSYGKPFLTNREDVHFNLSHSGGIICCVIDRYPVGIDVENIAPIDLGIACDFFSKQEYHDLFYLPDNERTNYFYKLWTLKESYIKAEGKGLSIPLDTFSFNIDSGDLISFKGDNNYKWDFALHNINTSNQNYLLGVCVHKGRYSDKIFEIPYTIL